MTRLFEVARQGQNHQANRGLQNSAKDLYTLLSGGLAAVTEKVEQHQSPAMQQG